MMSVTEGVVLKINEQGTAEILIQADPGGCIPGAPEVNHCHCSGCSSRITVDASNDIGALPGDRVQVDHRPGAVLRSVGSLLGIPALGLLFGLLAGGALYNRSEVGGNAALLLGGALFLAGVVAGIVVYRRVSAYCRPFINRILSKGITIGASPRTIDPVCGMDVNPFDAPAHLDYRGRIYYFCRSGCMKAFLKDPSKYIHEPAFQRG